MPGISHASVVALVLLAGSAAAVGQWSSDPAVNLVIADLGGDQIQPKIRPTADGGCYVSWFDNRSGGYDVYLQRLNAAGVEQWAHNGILIADRAVSSTEDYELVVDSGGNAVIAYNHDGGVAGAVQQIAANRVSPAGVKLWGETGVIVSDGATGKHTPRLAALSDGSFVVGYTIANSWGMQRVDANGVLQWPSAIVVNEQNTATPPQNLYMSLTDIQPSTNGSFIASWVRGSTTSFITSAKSLYTHRYDSSGAPQWNSGSPVIVHNTTSMSNGYFPTFLPDGEGGGVYGWYENGGSRHAYVQHVLVDGSKVFATPVANTGETPGFIRVGAGLAYDAANHEYYLASVQTTSAQSAYSVIVNKIDTEGTRLWGETGKTVLTSGTNLQPSFVQAQVRTGGGVSVFGFDQASSTTHILFSAGFDSAGTELWNNQACSVVSTKGRLSTTRLSNGAAALAWHDSRNGTSDIVVQNVASDGTLGGGGPAPCYANCDGSTSEPMLNVLDFNCFLNRFNASDTYANCDGSTSEPVLNVLDFNCFLNAFSQGCPR